MLETLFGPIFGRNLNPAAPAWSRDHVHRIRVDIALWLGCFVLIWQPYVEFVASVRVRMDVFVNYDRLRLSVAPGVLDGLE